MEVAANKLSLAVLLCDYQALSAFIYIHFVYQINDRMLFTVFNTGNYGFIIYCC